MTEYKIYCNIPKNRRDGKEVSLQIFVINND